MTPVPRARRGEQPSPMAMAWEARGQSDLAGRTARHAHGKPAATGGHAIVLMPAMALPR